MSVPGVTVPISASEFLALVESYMGAHDCIASEAVDHLLPCYELSAEATRVFVRAGVIDMANSVAHQERTQVRRLRVAVQPVQQTYTTPLLRVRLETVEHAQRPLLKFHITDWHHARDRDRPQRIAFAKRERAEDYAIEALESRGLEWTDTLPPDALAQLSKLVEEAW